MWLIWLAIACGERGSGFFGPGEACSVLLDEGLVEPDGPVVVRCPVGTTDACQSERTTRATEAGLDQLCARCTETRCGQCDVWDVDCDDSSAERVVEVSCGGGCK